MEKASRKTIWGLYPADLLGIIIMIIPFYITFKEFTYTKGLFLWVTTAEKTNIKPGLISSLCAVAFYVALMIRCQLFKIRATAEVLVSVIRTFLNCWVIASLMTMIVPKEEMTNLSISSFLKYPQSTLLLAGILLSWIGMRTVSGYCWILFIIAAWKHILVLDKAMNMWGAVYIISLAISMLLQITSHVSLTDLLRDFKGELSKYTPSIRTNMVYAANDAGNRAQAAADFVMAKVAPVGSPRPSFHVSRSGVTQIMEEKPINRSIPSGDASDLLHALDVNGDGIVDEKDIEMLRGQNHNK